MAIASLVVALAGIPLLCLCGVGGIAFIVAIVLGAIELSKIKKGESSRKGRGMALAAVIISAVGLGLGVLLLIFGVIGNIAANFQTY